MSHTLDIKVAGQPLTDATKALIMIHGRGGSATDILSLSRYLNVADYALLAPQATGHTWYPHSFMAPIPDNEPWLSAAIETIGSVVQHAVASGIAAQHIYFFGFSQGACLTLEFLARNAQRYGGAVAIIGGLIGEQIDQSFYTGNLEDTPIFIGTSDPDFHVPVERVHASAAILKEMNGEVTERVFENAGHTILQEELDWANQLIFK